MTTAYVYPVLSMAWVLLGGVYLYTDLNPHHWCVVLQICKFTPRDVLQLAWGPMARIGSLTSEFKHINKFANSCVFILLGAFSSWLCSHTVVFLHLGLPRYCRTFPGCQPRPQGVFPGLQALCFGRETTIKRVPPCVGCADFLTDWPAVSGLGPLHPSPCHLCWWLCHQAPLLHSPASPQAGTSLLILKL